jgi:hypothetical protein
MPPANSTARFLATAAGLFVLLILSSCVQRQPANDVGDPGFPFGPSAVTNQSLAYTPDIKPILDADCSECHSARRTDGNYSVANYSALLNNQQTGDAKTAREHVSLFPRRCGDEVDQDFPVDGLLQRRRDQIADANET